MKDEELAEQFATKECCTTCHNINHSCIEKCECWTFAKKGFLVGLITGRPKYHDLRKNPDDLPESGVQVLSEEGDIVVYKGDRFCWFEYSPNADNIRLRNWEKPVAWCEKPKLEKEDEE